MNSQDHLMNSWNELVCSRQSPSACKNTSRPVLSYFFSTLYKNENWDCIKTEMFCNFFFCAYLVWLKFLQPDLIYSESHCYGNANTDDGVISRSWLNHFINKEQGCPLETSLEVLLTARTFFFFFQQNKSAKKFLRSFFFFFPFKYKCDSWQLMLRTCYCEIWWSYIST